MFRKYMLPLTFILIYSFNIVFSFVKYLYIRKTEL